MASALWPATTRATRSSTSSSSTDRRARRLANALPDGDRDPRSALWTLLRPMLSPRLAALHADALAQDHSAQTTVDLAAHRGESTLEDLDLQTAAAA
jgi:hypothetical protein